MCSITLGYFHIFTPEYAIVWKRAANYWKPEGRKCLLRKFVVDSYSTLCIDNISKSICRSLSHPVERIPSWSFCYLPRARKAAYLAIWCICKMSIICVWVELSNNMQSSWHFCVCEKLTSTAKTPQHALSGWFIIIRIYFLGHSMLSYEKIWGKSNSIKFFVTVNYRRDWPVMLAP